MNITIRQVGEEARFEAQNERGHTVQLDDGSPTDGDFKGLSPMELLLSSVATCSSIDLVQILKKQRQPLESLTVEVDGERPEDTTPRPFQSIHIQFRLTGELDEKKVARAIRLSVEEYCSVAATLNSKVKLTYDFEVNQS